MLTEGANASLVGPLGKNICPYTNREFGQGGNGRRARVATQLKAGHYPLPSKCPDLFEIFEDKIC